MTQATVAHPPVSSPRHRAFARRPAAAFRTASCTASGKLRTVNASGERHMRAPRRGATPRNARPDLVINQARLHQDIAQRIPNDNLDHLASAIASLNTARIRQISVLGNFTNEYQVST